MGHVFEVSKLTAGQVRVGDRIVGAKSASTKAPPQREAWTSSDLTVRSRTRGGVTTLLDKEGNDKDGRGHACTRDSVNKAYLDEEYFEHLHGGDAKGEVGKLAVETCACWTLKPTTTFCGVEDRLPDETPNVDESAEPVEPEALYLVFELAACVTVGGVRGRRGSCQFLGRVKLQLSTMEDGARTRGRFQPLDSPRAAAGECGGRSRLEKWILVRLRPGGQGDRGEIHGAPASREVVHEPDGGRGEGEGDQGAQGDAVQRLAIAGRWPSDAFQQLLEFAKYQVNVVHQEQHREDPAPRRGRRQDHRRDRVRPELGLRRHHRARPGVDRTAYHSATPATTSCSAIGVRYSSSAVPRRHQRAERMEADERLSQGLPFAPESEEEERTRGRARGEGERKEEEEEQTGSRRNGRSFESLNAGGAAARKEQEKIVAEKRKAAEAAAAAKAAARSSKEAFSWSPSTCSGGVLQKQMDEVFGDDHDVDDSGRGGGAAERLAGVLSWRSPGSPPGS